MSLPHERLSELSILMDLRLAFGPGTRLWALRSREEFCYDWLQFKTRQLHADFRAFALAQYAREKAFATPAAGLLAIRRRIASVLRSYHLGRRASTGTLAVTPPWQAAESLLAPSDCARLHVYPPAGNDVTLAAAPKNPATFRDGSDSPVAKPKVAR